MAASRDFREEAALQLPADPASAGRARSFVKDALERTGHADLEDAAMLCVTELVANVSRHTCSAACTVTVRENPEGVLIEVADEDPEQPVMGPVPSYSERGRGLHIVSALSREWGVYQGGLGARGKSVWLRLGPETTT